MIAQRIKPPFAGRLVVVGGQARKVGKSALVVDLLQAFPSREWTAVKITPYAEAGCPVNGAACGCATEEHTYAIREEDDIERAGDSARFLSAGARRALWVQTKENQLATALPQLGVELVSAPDVIIESDAIARRWIPRLFLLVLDPANPDFKASARKNLEFADAFVFRSPDAPARDPGLARAMKGKATFLEPLGASLSEKLRDFVVHHLE